MAGLPKLVGLVGAARAGKDTVAGMLVNQYGYCQFAFADRIREVRRHLLGLLVGDSLVSDNDIEKDNVIPELGVSRRTIEQKFGTEFAHTVFGSDIWIRTTLVRDVLPMLKQDKVVVISDVRFHKEAEALTANGGVLIKIVRPGTGICSNHQSEQEWQTIKPIAAEIVNDGSLLDLRLKLIATLKGLSENETYL